MVMTHTQVNFSVSPWSEIGGRVAKLGKSGVSHGNSEGHIVYIMFVNVCRSTHSCGSVINVSFAREAF